MIGTEFQEMLRCIRCAACMNHCPVYGAIGGHAYGWVYPGPMGSVLTPSLVGVDQTGQPAQRLHLLRPLRERLPGEDPAARADAPLAGAGVRTPPDAGDRAQQPRPLGLVRAAARPLPPGDARGGRRRSGCSAAARGRFAACRWPAAGPRGATCRCPSRRHLHGAIREGAARDGTAMSKDAILGAIRRGLKRGPAAGGPAGDAGRAPRHRIRAT